MHQHYHLSCFTSQSYISLRWLKYVLLILYDKLYASVCLLISFQWSIGNPPLIMNVKMTNLNRSRSETRVTWPIIDYEDRPAKLGLPSLRSFILTHQIHLSWIRNDTSKPVSVIIIFNQSSMMPVSNGLLLVSPFHPQQTLIAQPCNIFFLFFTRFLDNGNNVLAMTLTRLFKYYIKCRWAMMVVEWETHRLFISALECKTLSNVIASV